MNRVRSLAHNVVTTFTTASYILERGGVDKHAW